MIELDNATVWSCRAESLLELALDELRTHGGGDDAIMSTELALAMLMVDMGELPEDEFEGYPFPGEPEQGQPCICSPEQLERGGFKGGCPVHSFGGRR